MTERHLISEREEQRAFGLSGRPSQSPAKFAQFASRLRERIAAAALADRKIERRLATTRYRLVGVDFVEEKPPGRARQTKRLAEVGFYDYDRDVLVVVVVAPRSGKVVRLEEREGVQPPPSKEEIEHARELALSDESLKSLRRRGALEVAAFTARAPYDDRRGNHRRVHLYFWTGGASPR